MGGPGGLIGELMERRSAPTAPFLMGPEGGLSLSQVAQQSPPDLDAVEAGDVVALVGDFDAQSIATLLHLIDRRAIIVPLTEQTTAQHMYFCDAAGVDVMIREGLVSRVRPAHTIHPLLDDLRRRGTGGLVLFSSGTTGQPKAILHDLGPFMARFRTPRPTLKTLNFLLFDHIGGINTLLHTLFNDGEVVRPRGRGPADVMADLVEHEIALLPTTPTFLRMLLLSGLIDGASLPALKIITYGTERMDAPTLERVAAALPHVDLRQTYGMSEIGILRVRSKARDSLWMSVGGEGVETRVCDGVLHIRSATRMLGYLNAADPFDAQGWYSTGDLVETDGDFLRITGRSNDVINVGGLKILPETIERAALEHGAVLHAHASGRTNPITGEHIELTCEPVPDAQLTKSALLAFLKTHLPETHLPHRITLGPVSIGHRFKRA